MSRELREAFDQYTRLAGESLRPKPQSERPGVVRLVQDSHRSIREAVAALEDTEVFGELVTTTRSAFHPKPSRRDHSMWGNSVQSFFRRSGFYLRAAGGQPSDPNVDFVQYTAAFETAERRVTYLAPLEHVAFATGSMEFGSFEVRRFTRDELAELLQVSINRVFYQWALTEIGPLDDYWYVSITRTVQRRHPGDIRINLADIDKIEPSFTRFPEISEALLPLVCFPWQADLWRNEPFDEQEAWHRFRIPFLIVVDADLLRPPRSRPAVERLDRESDFDSTTGEEMDTDRPVIWTSLNEGETSACEVFVRDIADRMRLLDAGSTEGQFFERANRYLLKGFFAEGFEQLLWHITTVDALLGDDAPGATKRLARRVAAILGTTATSGDTIRERFRELYHFRSRFVHGGAIEKQALTQHLRDARETARALLVWFVAFMTHTQDVVRREGLPACARKDLLAMIDLEAKAKTDLASILKVADTLPQGFPAVPSWLANQ